MGPAAARQAIWNGHQVTALEASPVPRGMAAHFDFSGISSGRVYRSISPSPRFCDGTRDRSIAKDLTSTS